MSRYIDANQLELELLKRWKQLEKKYGPYDDYVNGVDDCIDKIRKFPTADVQEVKHGKWLFETRKCLDTVDNNEIFIRRIEPIYKEVRICSECNVYFVNTNKIIMGYCPHCGAKMDKKD